MDFRSFFLLNATRLAAPFDCQGRMAGKMWPNLLSAPTSFGKMAGNACLALETRLGAIGPGNGHDSPPAVESARRTDQIIQTNPSNGVKSWTSL
jgi:hypothetical protein